MVSKIRSASYSNRHRQPYIRAWIMRRGGSTNREIADELAVPVARVPAMVKIGERFTDGYRATCREHAEGA